MHRTFSAFAVLSALVLPAAVAHAESVSNFDVSGNGLSLTFSLPTNPTPDGHDPKQDFYIGNISFVENGTQMSAENVYFYTKPYGGGFELTDSNDNAIDGLDFYGKKLFTGSVKNPTFKQGSFTLTGGPACTVSEAVPAGSPADTCSYNLDITRTSTSPTPEPSSLLLLGSGALGTLGALRRRFAR